MAVRAVPLTERRSFMTMARREALGGYLLVLPVCLVLLGLVAYPFIYAIVISFTSRIVGDPGHFVGLQNYRFLREWPSFARAIQNTVTLVIVTDLLKFFIGLGLALLLNERIKGRNIFRSFILLPWAMPAFVCFLTWRLLFEPVGGGINLILQPVMERLADLAQHLPLVGEGMATRLRPDGAGIPWLAQRSTAMPAVIIATVWRGFPFWCISFLAALQNVPQEQYEAAKVDGAGAWQRFRFITLPSIRHVIIVVTLLSSIWTANSFENIWIMTQGGPSDATVVLPVLAYLRMGNQRLGEAAAASVAVVPVLAILVFIVAALLQKE